MHVCSRIVKVIFTKSIVIISSKDRDTPPLSVKLNQSHDPGSIELQTKDVRSRCSKLANEEVLCIEAFAMKNMENQSLHCAFQLGIRRVSFDRPKSSPDYMIDGAGQILKVFNKERLWVFSIWRQWLHHAEHLTHIGFRLVEDALHSIIVKLTARFIKIICGGQASKLNDINGFGFMMNISSHPLKNPCLCIFVVATNMESGIELEQ